MPKPKKYSCDHCKGGKYTVRCAHEVPRKNRIQVTSRSVEWVEEKEDDARLEDS